jgi:hypothetical protein
VFPFVIFWGATRDHDYEATLHGSTLAMAYQTGLCPCVVTQGSLMNPNVEIE